MGQQVPTTTCRLPPLTYEKILAAFIDETSSARGNGGEEGTFKMYKVENHLISLHLDSERWATLQEC